MIQLSNIHKSYGQQVLFDGASLVLNSGERLGLVGRNGTGKSTLFKVILDEEHVDEGTVSTPKGYRIGKLSQYLQFHESTILAEACMGLPEDERDQTYRGEIILSGLGFSQSDMSRAPGEFSGGFQIRINLAKLLLSEPNLLLLDEPTNYLDIVSARWLAETLRNWQNEMIIITHDRSFMDSVTTHTALIYRGTFRKIQGGTQKMYEQVALDEEVYEKTRVNQIKKRKEIEQFVNRFRAQASKATLVQSRIKALEKMKVEDALSEEDTLEFRFAEREFYGKIHLEAKDLRFGFDPKNPLFKDLTFHVGKKDRIGIIGKNGRGKSTLLRVLVNELKPISGSVSLNPGTALSYFGQTNIDRLTSTKTVEEEITSAQPTLHRTKVRAICGTMMFEGDAALKKVNVLSGGERSRVLLGKIIATHSNLLLLDEPTNHLDMDSVESLKNSLLEFDGAVLLVTHDEMLLRELCTRLIVFQGDKPFVFEGDYDSFLSAIGWEDEEELKPTKTKAKEKKVPVEKSQPPRSETSANKEKDKQDKKIQKKIEQEEARIMKLETEQKELEKALQAATERGDRKDITDISYKLHEVIQHIEEAFEKLSSLAR